MLYGILWCVPVIFGAGAWLAQPHVLSKRVVPNPAAQNLAPTAGGSNAAGAAGHGPADTRRAITDSAGGNPLPTSGTAGFNWFFLNGQWQSHEGSSYTWTDANGNEKSAHSDYNYLIVFSGKLDGNTARGTLTLYGNSGGLTRDNILAQYTIAFSGGAQNNKGKAHPPLKKGNYEINLYLHGGLSTVKVNPANWQLWSYHKGIQEVGRTDLGAGVWVYPQYDWGTQRISLIPLEGQAIDTYIHGKWAYYDPVPTMVTHSCIATPEQKVLGVLFKLNPGVVGGGAKAGRIAVSVEGNW